MTDQTTTQTMPTPEPPAGKPKRLLRSSSDRMLGGVAGGLAQYFGVDAVIFRIAFGVTTLIGGVGLLTYLAILVFVPSEKEGAPGEPAPRRSVGRVILTAFAVLTATVGAVVLAAVAAWTGATGHGVVIAIAVILIGAMLVVGAFRSSARWLIIPALALAIPLGAVAAADVHFDDSAGERTYNPASFSAIPDTGYELGLGDMEVDLRDLPWKQNTVVELSTEMGLGETRIAVPSNVCVTGTVTVDAGNIDIAGDQTDGSSVELQPNAGAKATPSLILDSHVDVGDIRLVNDEVGELNHDRFRFSDDGARADDMRAAMAAACSPEPTQNNGNGVR